MKVKRYTVCLYLDSLMSIVEYHDNVVSEFSHFEAFAKRVKSNSLTLKMKMNMINMM